MLQTQHFSLYLRASLNYQKERSLKNIFFYIRKCRINTLANHFLTHSLTRRLTTSRIIHIISRLFQLTASQGGWRHGQDSSFEHNYISTHSLTGRLTILCIMYMHLCRISTHSLTGRLTRSRRNSGRAGLTFQLTASQGGWRILNLFSMGFNNHFNSQPHREADYSLPIFPEHIFTISTHSLTGRLTCWTVYF